MKAWYQKSSELGEAFVQFHQSINEKNSLDKKTKELISLNVASVLRCTHCTQAHIKKALAAGATPTEITDSLLLSSLVAASTQLFWDRDNFDKSLTEVK